MDSLPLQRDPKVTDAWIDELFNEFEVDKSSYMDDTEWEKLVESLGTRVEGRARMTAKCQSLETSDGAEYGRRVENERAEQTTAANVMIDTARIQQLKLELLSVKAEKLSALSSHAEAMSELATLREQHVAELDSMRLSQDEQSVAAEGALRSELAELQSSHAAAHAGMANLVKEHEARMLSQEQMQNDHVSSLEAELESLRSEKLSALSSHTEAINEVATLREQHVAELDSM